MYNIFQKYEIAKKNNIYNSILKKILIADYSKISQAELDNKINNLNNISNNIDSVIEIFSLIKESVNRQFGIKVHDEQILGGISLFYKNVIDMKTGEGKTIVALFPAIMNAKLNRKVHIITANDYLASRDYESMKPIYDKFNVSIDFISENEKRLIKKEKYKNDVVYTTAKSISFDYLNDNLVRNKEKKIIDNLDIAIIDEIDFVLIEEARSPVSISGGEDDSLYFAILFQDNIEKFSPNIEFSIDQKSKNIELNESGFKVLEKLLIDNKLIEKSSELYTYENTKYLQTLNQSLRANYTLKKDVDYIVRNDQIVIIDENTGRLSEGKTWIGGLHQAVEIKENVPVHKDSKTLATTSLQGFFSKYKDFVGMSGTAKNDSIEFKEIYGLDVIEIKTHKKVVRNDLSDILYFNKETLMKNLIKDIQENHKIGRPILIGTTSVKDSEELYNILLENNIHCEILNAKNHSKEASIIENAGKFRHVTISTNMAGRGTDIMLGGNRDTEIEHFLSKGFTKEESFNKWKDENKRINDLGGLHVVGFSRNTSRKIDDQLKGRSGRQGDNGSSRFYLSLEDELLAVYGKPLELLFNTLTMGVKTVGISDNRMAKHIFESQKKNETFLFNTRKSVVKYSEITEKQSDIICEMRNNILEKNNFYETVEKIFIKTVDFIIEDLEDELIDDKLITLKKEIQNYLSVDSDFVSNLSNSSISDAKKQILDYLISEYKLKREILEDNVLFEKDLILSVIDNSWTEHLTALENMKKGTSFRIYAQKNPFEEFKNESYKMFNFLIRQIYIDISNIVLNFNPVDFIDKIVDNNQNILPLIPQTEFVFLKANKYGY